MPATVRVIKARDFLHVKAEGVFDLRRSIEALREVVFAGAGSHDWHVLLDTRHAENRLSVADLWKFASIVADQLRSMSRKTAVLCPVERFDRAEFFALCAENRALRVRAFVSYEEAMDWLLDG
jgi:hypothetical protein